MNTNVPAAANGYVRMVAESDPWSRPVFGARLCDTLPTGYANHSPRTRLRSGASTARVPSASGRRIA